MTNTAGTIVEIQTTTDDSAVAAQLRDHLVASGLTPCVKIQSGCDSMYFWNGEWQNTQEIVLTVLTTDVHLDRLATLIRSMHNYENPEIVARPITILSDDYAQWIDETLRQVMGRHQ